MASPGATEAPGGRPNSNTLNADITDHEVACVVDSSLSNNTASNDSSISAASSSTAAQTSGTRVFRLPRIPKRKKTNDPSNSHGGKLDSVNFEPRLEWYELPLTPEQLQRVRSSDQVYFASSSRFLNVEFFQEIESCRNLPENLPALLTKTREVLHRMFYITCDELDVRESGILRPNCLRAIFESGPSRDLIPTDVQESAQMLWIRLSNRVFDGNMFRGLIKYVHSNGSYCFQKNMHEASVKTTIAGNGDFVNGQWWPNFVAMARDGVHRAIRAGVHGNEDLGAVSVVVTGGRKADKYRDMDSGHILWYSGTPKTDEPPHEITMATALLVRAAGLRRHIRVIRGSRAKDKSAFAPKIGYRYDGLYIIDGIKKMADDASLDWFFRLRRLSNQEPIRHTGIGARPNKWDEEAHKTMEYEQTITWVPPSEEERIRQAEKVARGLSETSV